MKIITQNDLELFAMNQTDSGEKANALKSEAEKLSRRAKAAMKAAETLPEAGEKARKLNP